MTISSKLCIDVFLHRYLENSVRVAMKEEKLINYYFIYKLNKQNIL